MSFIRIDVTYWYLFSADCEWENQGFVKINKNIRDFLRSEDLSKVTKIFVCIIFVCFLISVFLLLHLIARNIDFGSISSRNLLLNMKKT